MRTAAYTAFKVITFSQPRSFKLFLCFRCCEPHGKPFEHPARSACCTYNDVIKPIAYVIFEDNQLRAAVFEKMKISANRFPSMKEYKAWLGEKQDVAGAMYNIHEVILAYHELHPYGGTE
jgi:hypothetical protein